jgi:hypothetical protein
MRLIGVKNLIFSRDVKVLIIDPGRRSGSISDHDL